MADNNLNTQLQALQARLDRIDDDLIANYAGVSELVTGLAANPITAGSVAKSLKTYNFSAQGQKLQKKLIGLIPGVDTYRSLQNLETAGMLDKLESRLSAQADQMAQTIADELEAAATAQVEALEAQANALVEEVSSIKVKDLADAALNDATQQLETAISEGASAEVIEGLESAVSSATEAAGEAGERLGAAIAAVITSNAAVAQAVAFIGSVEQAAAAVTGFLNTLGEIAEGKTDSAVVQGTPPNTNPETQETVSEVVNKIV